MREEKMHAGGKKFSDIGRPVVQALALGAKQ